MSIKDQLTFSGTASEAGVPCPAFTPNKLLKTSPKCCSCFCQFLEHSQAAVTDEQVRIFIEQQNHKGRVSLVLKEEESGCGQLYVGGFQACQAEWLSSNAVAHVVNTALGLETFFVGWGKQLPQLREKLGLQIFRCDWEDRSSQKIWPSEALREGVRFVGTAVLAKHNVLIHCAQGKSRSVALAVAFLVVWFGWTVDRALCFVQCRRAIAEPNPGFMQDLEAFAQSPDVLLLRQDLLGKTEPQALPDEGGA
jgi:atypical dual specificity phosphatase